MARHHFVTKDGVEPATLDIESALGQDRQVHFGVELGRVVTGEVVKREGLVEHALHVVELPVVAEQVVEPEAEVHLIVLLEGVLEDQVVLVAHPPEAAAGIGQVVRVHAEVDAVAVTVRVHREAVFEPAVDLDRRVFHAEELHEQG